jgi:hypothetical protein
MASVISVAGALAQQWKQVSCAPHGVVAILGR